MASSSSARLRALSLVVASTLLACAAGDDPPTGPVTNASTDTSTSTTSAGGASTTSTNGSGGNGGAAITSTGSGGGSTTSAGGSTTIGAGGSGGAGGSPALGSIAALVEHGAAVAEGARFIPGTGWTDYETLDASAKSAAVVVGGTGARAVLRHSGTIGFADDELLFMKWASSGGFTAAAAVGVNGSTTGLPALAPLGTNTVLTFIGGDSKHYFSEFDGSTWSAFGPVPAGSVGVQAFGPSAPTIASTSIGDVVVYAGGDNKLYFAKKASVAAAFTLSSQAGTIGGLANALSPTPIVDAAGNLEIFYVRDSDRAVCRTILTLPAETWSAEQVVHATAITDRSPAAVLSPSGELYVSWHAFNTDALYFTVGTTTFATPLSAASPTAASNGPVLSAATESAVDAELLYASGSKLFHVRITGTTVSEGQVPGLTNVTGVAAATVP